MYIVHMLDSISSMLAAVKKLVPRSSKKGMEVTIRVDEDGNSSMNEVVWGSWECEDEDFDLDFVEPDDISADDLKGPVVLDVCVTAGGEQTNIDAFFFDGEFLGAVNPYNRNSHAELWGKLESMTKK